MPALVSVVVPVHDGAAHVAQTLTAVLAQTHADVELIVVDDGSSDDTLAEVKRAAPTTRVLRRDRAGGVSVARNEGLAAAGGRFVCFLDQDDIWHPSHLARQVAAFARAPELGAVVVPYQHWYPDTHGEPAPGRLWPEQADDGFAPDFTGWVYHQFLIDCWALTSATMLRREALDDVGAFDPNRPYGEDWELWLRLSRRWRFGRLGGPPVLYRQHPSQGSRRARDVDHRTELLTSNAHEHGLASRDGRAVPARLFRQNLARYRKEFGLQHLLHGDAVIGRGALWQAWRNDPLRLRVLAMAVAASAGWRPQPVTALQPPTTT